MKFVYSFSTLINCVFDSLYPILGEFYKTNLLNVIVILIFCITSAITINSHSRYITSLNQLLIQENVFYDLSKETFFF